MPTFLGASWKKTEEELIVLVKNPFKTSIFHDRKIIQKPRKGSSNKTMKIALQSKRAILSKSDDYTFDTSQAKTIMEIASVMFLFLKVFYGKY